MKQNPCEIPVVLSELTNRLINKLENLPDTMPKKEFVNLVNEICRELCLESEVELIKLKAEALLVIYTFLSEN